MYNQFFLSDPLLLERSKDFVKLVRKFFKDEVKFGGVNTEQITEEEKEEKHKQGGIFMSSRISDNELKEGANLKIGTDLLGDDEYSLAIETGTDSNSVLNCTRGETTIFQISGISSGFDTSSVTISGESVLLNVSDLENAVNVETGLKLTENTNELAFCIVGASGVSEDITKYTNTTSVTFEGSSKADRIYIYEDNVRVFGGTGDDELYNYGGNCYMYGNDGDDEIYCYSTSGIIMIDGGNGNNKIFVGSKETEVDDGDPEEALTKLLTGSGTLGEILNDEKISSSYSQGSLESLLKNKALTLESKIVSSKS